MHPFVIWLIAFTVWWFASSFFEWTLHRYVMHRPVGSFDYPFKAHAVIHHHVFKADHTFVSAIPVMPVAFFLGSWMVYIGALSATAVYYCVYEYIHWCMHLPKARRVERSWLFRRLNGHHLLHHRYMHKNFNVVMPLADLCLGTLRLRASTRFAQPVCSALPDVQPRQLVPEPVGAH
jgi:hypothetical protein